MEMVNAKGILRLVEILRDIYEVKNYDGGYISSSG
jgi:hypothetical protein